MAEDDKGGLRRGWSKEMLQELKTDREQDNSRLAAHPFPKGLPDPRQAHLQHIARRERLIRKIEGRMINGSQKLRRDFDQSR